MGYRPFQADLSGRIALITGANAAWARKPHGNSRGWAPT
jgi:hypothetical protein